LACIWAGRRSPRLLDRVPVAAVNDAKRIGGKLIIHSESVVGFDLP
jgi:hypothetical protein